jgi:NADPH:quinone reductase-like Zn-dependent oxidoreductase
MKLRYKIINAILLLVVVGIASLAMALSRNSACGPAPALSSGAVPMKAAVRRCYGPPSVLRLEDVEKPTPAANQVLVRVQAAAINPLDWHYMRGTPYVMRLETGFGAPKNPRLGVDFSGTVEAVGKDVKRFKPGDEVFGGKFGALAEYVTVAEDGSVVLKPDNLTFQQAASVGVAAVTALQALRDHGKIQAGQKVLINGASGGVGTFAVQIAKSFGAEVTGVTSTQNVELVQSLGADHVVDYKREDYTRGGEQYDLILDNVANRPLLENRQVLKPDGKYIIIGGGGPDAGPWVGPFAAPVKALVLSRFVSQDMGLFMAQLNQADLTVLSDLMQAGKVTPVVDRHYPLSEIAAAIEYLERGHARGKIVIDVE